MKQMKTPQFWLYTLGIVIFISSTILVNNLTRDWLIRIACYILAITLCIVIDRWYKKWLKQHRSAT